MAKKTREEGKLKQFTRQYKRKVLGGYLYVECPRPHFSFIKDSAWVPRPDVLIDVQDAIAAEGPHQTLACVFSRKDNVWYIVSHLWIATLSTWCPKEMRMYMEEVHSCMLKNLFDEALKGMTKTYPPINIYPTQEVHEDVKEVVIQATMTPLLERVKQEVAQEEAQPKQEEPKGWVHTVDKVKKLRESKQLEITIEPTEDEEYMSKLGISKTTYDAMVADGTKLVDFSFDKGYTHVLTFMKALQVAYQTKMSDIYKAMRNHGIIEQDMNGDDWKYNIHMSRKSMDARYGFTQHNQEKETNYPVFTIKGVTAVLFMLHQEGLIPSTLPSL